MGGGDLTLMEILRVGNEEMHEREVSLSLSDVVERAGGNPNEKEEQDEVDAISSKEPAAEFSPFHFFSLIGLAQQVSMGPNHCFTGPSPILSPPKKLFEFVRSISIKISHYNTEKKRINYYIIKCYLIFNLNYLIT